MPVATIGTKLTWFGGVNSTGFHRGWRDLTSAGPRLTEHGQTQLMLTESGQVWLTSANVGPGFARHGRIVACCDEEEKAHTVGVQTDRGHLRVARGQLRAAMSWARHASQREDPKPTPRNVSATPQLSAHVPPSIKSTWKCHAYGLVGNPSLSPSCGVRSYSRAFETYPDRCRWQRCRLHGTGLVHN